MAERETFAEWQQDWSHLWQACNWYTFRFCQIEFEWDKMMGGVEFSMVFLGLGFRIRHNYAETETVSRIRQKIAELESTEGSDG